MIPALPIRSAALSGDRRAATRLVQWVSADLLAELWRRAFGVDVRPSFRGATRFGLWESPTGLCFFDPPRAGDAAFYNVVYERMNLGRRRDKGPKSEFLLAAAHVHDGDSVLDVGCGFGAFRHVVPHARYAGVEPYGESGPAYWLHVETLATHLEARSGAYDIVSAFQVLERARRCCRSRRNRRPDVAVLAAFRDSSER